jgi:acetyl-CoA acyltransferase
MLRVTPTASRLFATATRSLATPPSRVGPNIVIVDAVRTPFVMSGTVFKDLMAVDLQKEAIKGMLDSLDYPFHYLYHCSVL